ncbi:TadE/TadG family type IV pilus assembly protein [Georgenia wangjunii]|uniref:TadE/TadG family type IV pilus assembly protein n=1 Tax=Georgenia wangjunii TaxID=3117730 RepID=UPI002F26BCB8
MSKQHRERGAAAVEFALVVPLLLLLVLGIAELGRAYNIQTTLSAAARDGVRVMALQNDPAAAQAVAAASASTLDPTALEVAVSPTACAATGATATVTVTYPMEFITGFLGLDDLTLTGKGTMRCNG